MRLAGTYDEVAHNTYGGDPVEHLNDLQNSKSVAGFGNATLAAGLGLQLNMVGIDPPTVPGPKNHFNFDS